MIEARLRGNTRRVERAPMRLAARLTGHFPSAKLMAATWPPSICHIWIPGFAPGRQN
jgi:hypothetical protein